MSRLSPLVRNGIIIVVIVAIAIAVRMFLPTDATSLQVGQCFDPPTTDGDVSGVDDGPCTDPHHAEVVFVGDYAPANEVYPTTFGFRDFVASSCLQAFKGYTGLDLAADTTYVIDAFTPTTDGWSNGNRKVICFALRNDDAPMTQSIKKT